MGDIFLNQGDVFEFLEQLEDASLDGVLTDLPYPTTERYRAIGTTTRTKQSTRSSNPWYGVMTLDELSRVLDVLYAKLKQDTYAFVYVDYDTAMLLQHMRGVADDLRRIVDEKLATSRAPFDHVGFGWRNPTTWVKTTLDSQPLAELLVDAGDGDPAADARIRKRFENWEALKLAPGTGYHGARCSELVLCLAKGSPQPQKGHRWNNVMFAPRPQKPEGATIDAGSPKPPSIAEKLTRAMSAPGGLICDPFVGCGTHAVGVTAAECTIIANDVDTSTARDWLVNGYKLEVNEW